MRSILITGCSSGIGLDAARGLKARGWRVFATCRQETDCERLRAEGLESFRLDYADEASIEAAVAEVVTRTGGTLDALFNNGAFACPGAVEDLPRGALREIFETNLFGYHDLTRRVIPLMREQGHGRIVNCSSVLGLVGLTWRGAYVATKFAMEGMTDVLRIEMRGTGIEVVLIEPGPIATKIRENAIPHFEQWIDWENSARREQYVSVKEVWDVCFMSEQEVWDVCFMSEKEVWDVCFMLEHEVWDVCFLLEHEVWDICFMLEHEVWDVCFMSEQEVQDVSSSVRWSERGL